jgi:predicted Rossmann fold nucleotide-binding protein DprA/Smf involved in DNA uptake
MTPFDDPYPARLKEQLREAAPPLLYYAGDSSLLEATSLAIVGSRHVGHEELEITRAAARVAVGRGAGVTSGGARGVDQVAMTTAFEQGGAVTGVLADSLSRSCENRKRVEQFSTAARSFCRIRTRWQASASALRWDGTRSCTRSPT